MVVRISSGCSMGCSCRTRSEVKDLIVVFLYVILLFLDCFESNFIIYYDDWRPYPVTPRVSVIFATIQF